MPFTVNAGARLWWTTNQSRARPAVLLLNSIGTDHTAWNGVRPLLQRRARALRMDMRGHGASAAPAGEYSLDLLADDALAVLDAAKLERAVICGVSLGGMVALNLALRAPERVAGVIAACTSPKMDEATWRARIAAVKSDGMASIVEAALSRFVSPGFASAHPDIVDDLRKILLWQSPAGYVGCAAAIRDMDLRPRLGAICAPTLVIGGTLDVSTPFEAHGRLIADAVPGARVLELEAGHLAHVEAPDAFAAAIRVFLQSLDAGPQLMPKPLARGPAPDAGKAE